MLIMWQGLCSPNRRASQRHSTGQVKSATCLRVCQPLVLCSHPQRAVIRKTVNAREPLMSAASHRCYRCSPRPRRSSSRRQRLKITHLKSLRPLAPQNPPWISHRWLVCRQGNQVKLSTKPMKTLVRTCKMTQQEECSNQMFQIKTQALGKDLTK